MAGGGKTVQTNEVKLPEWLNKGSESVFSEARAAAAANPITAYKGPMAAGSNVQLDTAANNALNTGAGSADLERARQLTAAGTAGQAGRVGSQDFDSAQVSRYMDPYQQAVQGNTIRRMMEVNAQERQGLGDGAAGQRAYGGSRHAILEAEQSKGQNQNIMDYLARSNSEGYNDAYAKFAGDRSSRMGAEATNAGLDQSDFMRQMQGGAQMAGIGSQAQGMQTQDIDNLVRTGAVQQGTEEGKISADYDEFLRMQDAPLQRYKELMGLLTGAPTNRTETGTTRQKSSLGGQLLGAGLGVASIFSDRRLKRDIERVGSYRGAGIYTYRYLWGVKRHVGMMADEVRKFAPEAVSRAFGFDMVDYAKLGG